MQDSASGLYPENLLETLDELGDAASGESIEVLDLAQRFLDREDLWSCALRIGADADFIDLLVPAPDRRGATWYLYDLIERGELGSILGWIAGLLDMLMDEGVIPPTTLLDVSEPTESPIHP